MIKIGTIICGKYEIIELVGKGGMSNVYKAIDVNLKKEWAIKEIRKNVANEADRIRVQSAIVEADMMKKLDHPAIPRVVDIIENVDVIYVVMDYIEGDTLESILSREGCIPLEKAVEWAKVLCEVLSYLHRQTPPIIYRDMKPGNVIVTADGNVKLIDFGIAREYKNNDTTDTVCLGTRGYAAPEQATGITQTDQRTDIYNLGATFYQLLTGKNPGRLPAKGYVTGSFGTRMPEGLEYIIEKCMQQKPAARYQCCEELLADLENYESIDRYGRTKDYYRKRSFWKELLTGLGGVLVALVILFVVQFLKQQYQGVSEYDRCMQEAENALESELKREYYLRAIETRPNETEPYFGLIALMGADAKYEVTEEEILRLLVERNRQVLQKQEEYARLAFELGMLYLNCYDYGKTEQTDNEMTRIKSAHHWLEEALQYGEGTDEFYVDVQKYCAMGDYVEVLVQKPFVAPDWGNYEVYGKEAAHYMESVYGLEEPLTKMMGSYIREGTQIKVIEMNMEPLCLEKMSVFLEKNGVLHELLPGLEYTVVEKGKSGEQYVYEYCVNEETFCEEGIYGIELFSVDENGRIYQNVRGINKIEIVFGIDKTPPNIFVADIGDSGEWFEDNWTVTIIAEDNMVMESVDVFVNKEKQDTISDNGRILFEIGKDEEIETITVIARDAAGNETRTELEEVRRELGQFDEREEKYDVE